MSFKIKNVTLLILFSLSSLLYGLEDNSKNSFIFSHGFGSAGVKVKRYIAQGLLPENAVGFNYVDAKKYIEPIKGLGIGLRIRQCCLAQENDIRELTLAINATEKDCILYGESRGSSAILNYLGTMPKSNNKIAGAILDSPFDSLQHVFDFQIKRLRLTKITSIQSIEKIVSVLLPNYKKNGIQPINVIKNVPTEIPLLIICSQKDTKVPWKSAVILYKALRENNHQKVHILILPYGSHAWIMEGAHKTLYRNVVHAFYKRYGIEHNEEWAQTGKDFFENYCQLNADQIEDLLNGGALPKIN